MRGAEGGDGIRNHVAVDADGGDARSGEVGRVRRQGLRDERPDLAGRVGALEGGEVDELDDLVERPRLRGGLDRAGAETGGALLEADGVDAAQPLEVQSEAAFGELAAEQPDRPLGRCQRDGSRGRRCRFHRSSLVTLAA